LQKIKKELTSSTEGEKMSTGWNEEQRDFLREFYNGIADPDTRFEMLKQELGYDQVNFHSKSVLQTDEGIRLVTVEESRVLISTKIAILEYNLLEANGLLIPDLY
jgi:hypothetical protein